MSTDSDSFISMSTTSVSTPSVSAPHTLSSSLPLSSTLAQSSSSSDVAPLPSIHPMNTKSKVGIFKPKIPLSLLTTTVSTEPRNFHKAIKYDV